MNKRNKIIVSIVGITIVMLALLGITYAYYLTRIEGNTNTNSISITTADLSLTYGDGTTEILTSDKLLMPGEFEGTKDFTVTNNGNASVTYGVILEDMINPLSRPQDMKMILSCSSSKNDGGCSGLEEMNLPSTNEFLVENTIEVGETHTYELKLSYIEAGEDQSIDMGKTISGKVNIIDSHDTVDMTGVVANYEEGDYVQVNSEPKISYITKDGKYKVVGLRPEQHTIAVYKSDGTLKGDRELTIKNGTSESISENEITVTKDTRTIRMNVTAINSDNTITTGSTSLDKYNPFKSGTLAYEILNNANNATEEEMLNGIAKYMEKPLTIPAQETNKVSYNDGEPDLEYEISSHHYVYSTSVNNNSFYTFGDSIKLDDSNKIELTNLDGSSIMNTQDCSQLVGKYVINAYGSNSSDLPSTNDLNYVHYIVEVTDDKIYFSYIYEDDILNNKLDIAKEPQKHNKITYGDSYEFDELTGNYIIVNSDGSKLKTVTYEEAFNTGLVGKYINLTDEYYYEFDTTPYVSSYIFVITEANKYSLTYAMKTKEIDISIENIISKSNDDLGTSYYYRGDVKNNYISFANMCWRIVRIQGDGSIKLILEDEHQNCSSSMEQDYDIARGKYGTINQYTNANSGTMSYNFKVFQTNKLSSYYNKLRSGSWCSGNTRYIDENGLTKDTKGGYYDAWVRLYRNNRKSLLTCNGDVFDTFADGTPMYVATITADEFAHAGGSTSSSNRYFYIYTDYLDLSDSTQYFKGRGLAMLTPVTTSPVTSEMIADMRSGTGSWRDYTSSVLINRPMIILKSGILFNSGDGTVNNAYTVN